MLRFFDARLSDEEADAVDGLELAGGGFSIIDFSFVSLGWALAEGKPLPLLVRFYRFGGRAFNRVRNGKEAV